jgi:hypothetical protein
MTAAEHQVRFAKLHEKRAEVIAELYERAVDTQAVGQKFVMVSGYNRDPAKLQEAALSTNEKLLEFYVFTERNRIYLPEETCILLKTFVETMRKHVTNVDVYGSVEYPTPQTTAEKHTVLREAYDAFQRDIPAVRKALEHDFREMLGVENLLLRKM